MSNEWMTTTLGQIVTIKAGKYVPRQDYIPDGEFWIFGSNSIMGKYDKALVDVPHVIMAAIGAYAGAVRYSEKPSWVNNNAFALIPADSVDAFYLYLWLESAADSSQFLAGTGQPYVKRPSLLAQGISLPPVAIQRRIVDLLAHLDNHIANLRLPTSGLMSIRNGRGV
jgi:type I restriction enzyme S subunit